MPKTNRKNLAVEERREAIFRYASQVFAAKGFAGTKIADIATAAGMSQGLLYRHFSSKEELFNALIETSFAKLTSAAEALEAMPIPVRDKIELALQRLVAGIATDPVFSERVMLIAQASISEQIPEATKAIIAAERDKPYAAIARIMALGQAQSCVLPGPPEVLAMLFWTTIKGLALHKVSFGDKFRVPETEILCRPFLVPTQSLTKPARKGSTK